MDPTLILPAFDPIPHPGPVWLLKALLLLTLSLHLIAMNMLFGGVWTALFSRIKANKGGAPHHEKLYRQLVGFLPTLVAMTVTLGVAPLLFVQVLYGQFVYTASIAMGWFWWLVWVLVIIAYYSLYYLKFKAPNGSKAHSWIPWAAALSLLWVSFTLSNVFNLAQQPERFTASLLETTKGWNYNLGDHSTFPRWLHIMLGAVAVAGIWIMWLGRLDWKKERDFAAHKLTLGYKLFAYPTMANIVVGFAYMMTLPRDVMMRLMGQGMLETALWLIGMGLAIWAIPLLKRGSTEPESAALPLGTILMTVTVVSMIILRDIIRSDYLKPYYNLGMPQVSLQWGPIALFFVTFVIGLGGLYWLIVTFLKGKNA